MTPRIAIAHDYLTQRGGAERVALSLMRAFPGATLHTLVHDPELTYPEFRDLPVRVSPLNRVPLFRHDPRYALPLLARAASRMHIDADIVVASSSGWAHGFPTTGRKLVYCHNPARWLYQTSEHLGRAPLLSPIGLGLLPIRPALRRWDHRAARSADRYLANSFVVRSRIQGTYGFDAQVVPPPHGARPELPQEPVPGLADWSDGYLLVVSRLLPYKHVDVVVDSVRGTDQRLVVVGRGPLEHKLRHALPGNARLFGDLTDAQLRWVYAHARLLVAASHEDFGLTPPEAAAFGVPAVTLRAGGYLDTTIEGVTAEHFEVPTAAAIRAAVARAEMRDWDRHKIIDHAEEFGEAGFATRIRAEVEELLEGGRTQDRGRIPHSPVTSGNPA